MSRNRDPLVEQHREWLGYVQPVGLVFAPAVLADRQVTLETRPAEIDPWSDRLEELLDGAGEIGEPIRVLRELLDWPPEALLPAPPELDRALPELEVTLRADFAVPRGKGEEPGWLLLVKCEPEDARLDRPWQDAPDGWHASPAARFERLLREAGIAIGLLLTPRRLRLVHAPRGESSGHLDFVFAHLRGVAGRPILAALRALLRHDAVRAGPPERRLASLLRESRERQATVSETLGRQVQEALAILLDGFVEAAKRQDPERGPARLAEVPGLYEGLVTVLMRLVFLLYAEERDLVLAAPGAPAGDGPSAREVYEQSYGVGGLFARLEEDAARFPDTMDDRYGAWAQLLVLFRLVHAGGGTGDFRFVRRGGTLFDPERFPFLEGRAPPFSGKVPSLPDGTVHRVLEKLSILDGERLSYRTLDVEEIGSVYQQLMGFEVATTGPATVAIKARDKSGAALYLSLEELLAQPPAQRDKWFEKRTGHDLRDAASKAGDVEALFRAVERLVVKALTPQPLPAGLPVLQPTDERRRTGSHYTPRALTEPLVEESLRPIFERLGPRPTPEAILDLAILDPAMGSGAFLVEACRQLAEKLVAAWEAHGRKVEVPADEDRLLFAKRLVATRCLYGVDKNPLTVELAKLSLWLETLAKDHEFTFLDHALRCGDSLVGLLLPQLEGVDFDPERAERNRGGLLEGLVRERLAGLVSDRRAVGALAEELGEVELSDLLRRGEARVADLGRLGDAIVSAFFAHATAAERERALGPILERLEGPLRADWAAGLEVQLPRELRTFHWPLVFPEVFTRPNPGFDAILGNPPYGGQHTIRNSNPSGYLAWLKTIHGGAHGNADLVAHFFRRAWSLLREGGTIGFLATNTVAQGDTRASGLAWLRRQGAEIYSAQRRYKWPGEAAVVVSVVHLVKGPYRGTRRLGGKPVERITAFLVDHGDDEDPRRLAANAGRSFIGSYVLGMGFTFDDTDNKGVASPTALMHELIAKDPRNAERIFPYIGGEELNDDPEQKPRRWVINFEDMSEEEARGWPDLFRIVEERVKPERLQLKTDSATQRRRREYWWQYGSSAKDLYTAIRHLPRVLALSRVSKHLALAFLPAGMVYSEQLVVFALSEYAAFACLQSRVHEVWARFFASSLGDGLRYTPSDCFETFPFPEDFRTRPELEEVGRAYYQKRAELMRARSEGLRDTYNRFHDPDEHDPEIQELRRLHAATDRAVLRAYGWADLAERVEPVFLGVDEPEFVYRGRLFWPEPVRAELLGRLLERNAELARAEAREATPRRRGRRRRSA